MSRKRRDFNTFNLSFLDIMSCGFGAVVLVYLIMNHAIEDHSRQLNQNLQAEVDMLDYEVTEGEAGLVDLRNTLSEVNLQVVEAQGRASRIAQEQKEWEAKIETIAGQGYSDSAEIDTLKAELLTLETEMKKLKEASEARSGRSVRKFIGEGNRQYLTGLHLGGRHIAILLDTSSSMLADRLVQIIRLRNMDEAVQRSADKWIRALKTVDWLTAQLPATAQYQLITFATAPSFALSDSRGKWLNVANRTQLEEAVTAVHDILPSGGTSLENAFLALRDLSPQPDNIFLITDGLPTQGTTSPKNPTISGAERIKLFRSAIKQLPANVPVNIILAPMEGDPMAASELWKLAQSTRGSFLSPARDWP